MSHAASKAEAVVAAVLAVSYYSSCELCFFRCEACAAHVSINFCSIFSAVREIGRRLCTICVGAVLIFIQKTRREMCEIFLLLRWPGPSRIFFRAGVRKVKCSRDFLHLQSP